MALACAVLGTSGIVEQHALDGTVLLGELALDGRLRPVRGMLPCLLAARAAGMRRVVVPESALEEAALVDGIAVFGARSLTDVLAFLHGRSRKMFAPPVDSRASACLQPSTVCFCITADGHQR